LLSCWQFSVTDQAGIFGLNVRKNLRVDGGVVNYTLLVQCEIFGRGFSRMRTGEEMVERSLV